LRTNLQLFAFGLSFVLLSVGGAYWAMWSSGAGLSDLNILWELGAGQIVLLAILCAGIYASDLLRYRCLGLAVGAPVSNAAAMDASVANFFFSWITPGSTFGAPASIYMLGRRGVPWDAAVVIAFGKAFTGVALVCFVSLVLVALELGPEFDSQLLYLVLFGGGVFLFLVSLISVAAFRPEGAKRRVEKLFGRLGKGHREWVHRVEQVTIKCIDRLARLRGGGAPLLLALSHLLYFAIFAGVAMVLIVAFGGQANLAAAATTVVYIAFTYIAPTPGGAGFAEAMALPFFGHILPAEQAVMMVLSFRALTLALQICFGLPYLLVVGGVSEALRQSSERGDP
jgi:uncharacterized protein (TIRG00374 family)